MIESLPPASPSQPLKIAAFFSHPTQHHAPWFRALAGRGDVDLKVFYFAQAGVNLHHDRGFGNVFQWDIPLLDGYQSEFLPTLPGLDPTYTGVFRMNSGVRAALQSQPWDAVMNPSYTFIINWVIWLNAISLRLPLIYFSDSTLTQPRTWWRRAFKELPTRLFFSQGNKIFLSVGDNNHRYLNRYGVPDQAIYPCPYPVDVQRFQKCRAAPGWSEKIQAVRAKYRIAKDDRVAVFCGKLIARKRPSDLALAILKLNSPRLKGLFIGTGPLAESLQRLAPDQVTVTGFINQSEIPYYLGAADVLVMPSEIDPHPLAVTEAAGLGVPAIVSDTCGCWGPHDILRPGENGLTYPCGDLEALAKNLKLLLFEQEDLRRRMSARALELAATQDVGVAAEAVVQAVRAYLRQKPSPGQGSTRR